MFGAAFCVYALTASAAVGWLDSPEFVASAADLGIAHAPGHPLPALLGRLAGLMPIGDLALRVSLMSGLLAATAAWALYAGAREVLCRAWPDIAPRTTAVIAAAAALAFALSYAMWSQAVRAEVYALQALLSAGTLAAVIAYDRARAPRWLLTAGLLGGLSLANHHLIAVTVLVPAAAFVLLRPRGERASARTMSLTAVAGIVGLAALIYLPVRASRHPEVNWGAPDTAERFAWTVSAKAFQKSVGGERPTGAGEDSARIGVALVMNAGVPIAALALIGLYAGVRRRQRRGVWLLLGGVIALGAGARALVGFELGTPDHHAYLVPALAALALLAVAGAGAIGAVLAQSAPRVRRWAAPAAAAGVALAVPLQVVAHHGDANLRDAYASDAIARWELDSAPPRALLLIDYFETSYRVAALRAIEGARPDVAVLDLAFLTYPGFDREARLRYPELAPIIDAPLRLGSPLPIEALQRVGRPVLIQLQPELDPRVMPWVVPRGPFARLLPGAAPPRLRAELEREDVRARAELGVRFRDPAGGDAVGVRNTLLWHDFNRLRYYCRWVAPTAWTPPEDGLLRGDCAFTVMPGESPRSPSPPAPDDRDRGAGAGAP